MKSVVPRQRQIDILLSSVTRINYFISLAVFIIGVLLVLSGTAQIQGSLGVPSLIQAGLWQLVPGVVCVAVGGPLFYYFRARKNQKKTAVQLEVAKLADMARTKEKN